MGHFTVCHVPDEAHQPVERRPSYGEDGGSVPYGYRSTTMLAEVLSVNRCIGVAAICGSVCLDAALECGDILIRATFCPGPGIRGVGGVRPLRVARTFRGRIGSLVHGLQGGPGRYRLRIQAPNENAPPGKGQTGASKALNGTPSRHLCQASAGTACTSSPVDGEQATIAIAHVLSRDGRSLRSV
jgi:hypothetical protein